MIEVHACTMIIVQACATIMVRARTMITVHESTTIIVQYMRGASEPEPGGRHGHVKDLTVSGTKP